MLNPFVYTTSKRALTVGFGALLISIILITLFSISRIYAINQSIETLVYEQNFKSEALAALLMVSHERQQIMAKLFAVKDPTEWETESRRYEALTSQLIAALGRLEKMESTVPERAAIADARAAAVRAQEVREREVAI